MSAVDGLPDWTHRIIVLPKWDTGMGENKYMQKYNTDMLSHTSSLVQNIFCLRPEISVGLDFCSRSSFYSFGAFLILICQ